MAISILPSKRGLFWYGAAWGVLLILQLSIVHLATDLPFIPTAIDGIVSTFVFAILGTPIWYITQLHQPDKTSTFNLVTHIITFGVVTVGLWTLIVETTVNYLTSPWPEFSQFASISLAIRIATGTFIYLMLTLVYYLMIYYNNLQEKVESEARLQEMLTEVELNMLKSQINPHFLFNSLNSISSLTITAPERAREMLVKLSDYLRYSISIGNSNMTTLGKEIDNITRYLEIEKVRFGSKLQYNFELNEEESNCKIPPMILQPLYENAVKHGVYESTSEIYIQTRIWIESGLLNLRITNNFEPGVPSRKGAGVGIKNIKERLRLTYRSDQLLQTQKHDGTFEVLLTIPQTQNDKP